MSRGWRDAGHPSSRLAAAAALLLALAALAGGCGATLTGLAIGAAAVVGGGGSSGAAAAPALRLVGSYERASLADPERIDLRFDLFDATGAPVDVAVRAAPFDAAVDFAADRAFAATEATGASALGLAASAAGVRHDFVWDAQGDLAARVAPLGASKVADVVVELAPRRGGVAGLPVLVRLTAGHTPPAVVALAGDPGAQAGVVRTPVALLDAASDAVSVRVFVSAPGLSRREAPLASAGAGLPTSPTGVATQVFWSSRDAGAIGFRTIDGVTVEVDATDRFGATGRTTTSVSIENAHPPSAQILAVGTASGLAPVDGRVPIRFALFDPEADLDPTGPSGLPDVRIRFSADDGATFEDATGIALREGGRDLGVASLSGLRARPFPVTDSAVVDHIHTFLWDAYADGMGGIGPHTAIIELTPVAAVAGEVETVALRLGDAAPVFAAPAPVASSPVVVNALAIGDLDGDGAPDVVAEGFDSADTDTLLVYRGRGDGTLGAAATSPLSRSIAVSLGLFDLDGDGRLDVLIAWTDEEASLSVLYGEGDGTFGPEAAIPLEGAAVGLDVGDLDGDGRPDIVCGVTRADGSTGVQVLLGAAGRTWTALPAVDLALEFQDGIAIGDFDGDGLLDVAAASQDARTFLFLRGRGDGTLEAPVPAGGVPLAPLGPVVGDLDGDGRDDVLALDPTRVVLGLALGDAAAGLLPVEAVTLTATSFSGAGTVYLADVDGDGRLDILDATAATVDLRLGLGGRRFGTGLGHVPSLDVFGVVADVDGDGRVDIVSPSESGVAIDVMRGGPGGGFGELDPFNAGTQPVALAVGDLDGDGLPDSVVVTGGFPEDETVVVRRGLGDGRFGPASAIPIGVEGYVVLHDVVLADVDGDGRLDAIVVLSGEDASAGAIVDVLLGDGAGGLGAPVSTTISIDAFGFAAGDLDGDGRIDIVAVDSTTPFASVSLGSGGGAFAGERLVPLAAPGVAVALGDLDGDGALDAAISLFEAGGAVAIALGTGDGGFTLAAPLPAATEVVGIALADLDGDGRLDVVAAEDQARGPELFLGLGGGLFAPPVRLAGAVSPETVRVADVDGDGRLDVVASSFVDGALEAFAPRGAAVLARGRAGRGDGQSTGEGAPLAFARSSAPVGAAHLALADVNGDGLPDVVALSAGEVVLVAAATRGSRAEPALAPFAGGAAVRSLPAAPLDPDLASPPRGGAGRLARASPAVVFSPEGAVLADGATATLPLRATLTREELDGAIVRVFEDDEALADPALARARIDRRTGAPSYATVFEVARRDPSGATLPADVAAATIDVAAGTVTFPIARLARFEAFLDAPTTTAVLFRATLDEAGPDGRGERPRPTGWAASELWRCGAPSATALALGTRPAPASAPCLLAIGLRSDLPAVATPGALVATVTMTAFPLGATPAGGRVLLRTREWHDLGAGAGATVALVVRDPVGGGVTRVALDALSGTSAGPVALSLLEVDATAAVASALDALGDPPAGARASLELSVSCGASGRGWFLDDVEVVLLR